MIDDFDERSQNRGSLNHSVIQARLARWLPDDNFTIATELSLDVSQIDLTPSKDF